MNENPDYWNTIATVIPVLALTYSTALKRSDWHKLKAISRRWTALYGAFIVSALAWAEWVALNHLQHKTTDDLDEGLIFFITAGVSLQVLAVPVAPLIVLAVHDLHPRVVRAKRALKADVRELAKIRREYDEVVALIDTMAREQLIQGMEQVLRDPHLVYGEQGAVLPGYQDRVPAWRERARRATEIAGPRARVEAKFKLAEKRHKRSQKRLAKVLRSLTKRAAKLTELHR